MLEDLFAGSAEVEDCTATADGLTTAIAAAITSLKNTVASLAAQLAKVKTDVSRVLYVEAAA